MTTNQPNVSTQSHLADLKAQFREAIATYGGDPSHGAIAPLIDQLAGLNPTQSPTLNPELMDGDWLLISAPKFPDGILREDGRYQYKLGRLSFNMFQPVDLELVIDRVWQPVWPIDDGEMRTHDIVVEFTTIRPDQPALQGRVKNLGICKPLNETTLQVKFTGGVLEPMSEGDRQQWQQLFGDQTAQPPSSLKNRLMQLVLKFMFGLVKPDGMNPETGQIEFKMTRSPNGKLDVLFLDNELRITRGQKETVLICERQYR